MKHNLNFKLSSFYLIAFLIASLILIVSILRLIIDVKLYVRPITSIFIFKEADFTNRI